MPAGLGAAPSDEEEEEQLDGGSVAAPAPPGPTLSAAEVELADRHAALTQANYGGSKRGPSIVEELGFVNNRQKLKEVPRTKLDFTIPESFSLANAKVLHEVHEIHGPSRRRKDHRGVRALGVHDTRV